MFLNIYWRILPIKIDNMDKRNFLIKNLSKKKTTLDKIFSNYVKAIMDSSNEEFEARWELYHMILDEFNKDGLTNYYDEVRYRITDGENPNSVFIDIINRQPEIINDIVWYLKNRLEEFNEEDFFNSFIK